MPDVLTKFYRPAKAYLNAAIQGSPLRVEAVITGKSAGKVLGLIPSYGMRIVDFCLSNRLLVTSTRDWPHRPNFALTKLNELMANVKRYVEGYRNVDVSCLGIICL